MEEFFQQIRKAVTPPSWDSWKTLIWISVFSWAVALLAGELIEGFIASVGWIFLIGGVHWGLHDDFFKKGLTFQGFFVGPWITGALVCIFLFGGLIGLRPMPIAGFLFWFPISALIAVSPKFIKAGPDFKIPDPGDRQQIVNMLLANLLISCWFQLYFSTQNWLSNYPSVLADDLSRSPFVSRFSENRPLPRGVVLLNQAEDYVEASLAGKPWSQVERWLLELDSQVEKLNEVALSQIPNAEENDFWKLQGRTLQGQEYALQLIANWTGPSLTGSGYHLTRTCKIARRKPPDSPVGTRSADAAETATVECGPIEGPRAGQPVLVAPAQETVEAAPTRETMPENRALSDTGTAEPDRP